MTRRASGVVLRAVRAGVRAPTDHELLVRFTGGDQGAFATLVARHAGMVLGVCRRALSNVQDAEDACQATFLVLANRATDRRWQESVANWLYTTARRIASRVNRTAARRAKREARLALPDSTSPLDQMTGREAFAALDEELDKLPARYREPLVLCYFEGLTRDEAAARLGVPAATLKSQLERGRKKLGDALIRRGVALGAGLLAVAVTSSAGASPPDLVESILTAALGAPSAAVGELARGVAVNGSIHKVVFALVVFAAVAAGAGSFGVIAAGQPAKVAADAVSAGVDVRAVPDVPAPGAKSEPLPEKFTYQGRAIGPDGKPVKGARVFLHWHSPAPQPLVERARTDAEGRFSFEVKRAEFDFRSYELSPMPWRWGHLIASAPDLGVAWAQELTPGTDAELRFSADDAPIEGRLLNLQGEPLVRARVRALWVMRARSGDLAKWQEGLKGIKEEENWRTVQDLEGLRDTSLRRHGLTPAVPVAVTGQDGRFTLKGVGRERLALVRIEGDGIESRDVFLMPRPGAAKTVDAFVLDGFVFSPGQTVRPKDTFLGTKFELNVPPCRVVTGTVTDFDTGKPVPGAIVSSGQFASGVVDRYRTWTVTDALGRYTLHGLPVSKGNQARVEAPEGEPYLTVMAEGPDGAGLEPSKLDVRLKRGVWLMGTVLDRETKKPVPQATVRYAAHGENPNLKAVPGWFTENNFRSRADDGSFRVPILPGKGYLCVVVVEAAGRARYGLAGDVPGGLPEYLETKPFAIWPGTVNSLIPLDVTKDGHQDVVLTPARGVVVTILGPDGEKLKGVIAFTGSGRDEDRVKDDGTLTVRGVSANRAKYVQAVCPEKKLAGLLKVTSEDKTATLKLQPWLAMKGRVVDEDDQPIADAELSFGNVLASPVAESFNGFWYKGGPIRTGKDGTYQIEGLVPGAPYNLFMKAKGQMVRGLGFRAEWKADDAKDWGDWKPGP
jgi:RNA polymerase sigma factor (sigma-70 family)